MFSDADCDNASIGIVAGIFAAAGQTCIAGSRVFAQEEIYDELVEKIINRASKIKMGDPLKDDTELGPLAFAGQLEKVESYVQQGIAEGAKLQFGGSRPDVGLPGYFFSPTVFTEATNEMTICREEIFGPVVAIMPFKTEEEVLAKANDTSYGLAAGVWTSNLQRAIRMSDRLEAGTVWLNMYRAMSPTSPRQGFKNSGVGIEHGVEAINEYTRLKSVWINTDESPMQDPFILSS